MKKIINYEDEYCLKAIGLGLDFLRIEFFNRTLQHHKKKEVKDYFRKIDNLKKQFQK